MKKIGDYLRDFIWKPKNLYSLDHLKYIYDVLCKNRIVTRNNRDILVEVFKEMPEVIIWGDQHDPKIFEYFSSNNMMIFFIIIIRQKCGAPLTYQILQALNIILENIRDQNSLNWILSNNNMNCIITCNYNTHLDEILALYMSLLKILSIRLNNKTVDFLFDYKNNDFPILTEGLNFYDHKENMIRINVRNIFLNVLKLQITTVDQYFLNILSDIYFSHISWKLRSLVDSVSQMIYLSKYSPVISKIRPNVDEICDILQYINDLLSFVSSEIFKSLSRYFYDDFFCKFLWCSLTTGLSDNSKRINDSLSNTLDTSQSDKHVDIFVLYYTIAQIIVNISHDKMRQRIIKHYFQSPLPNHNREDLEGDLTLEKPISIQDYLEQHGIVRRNYNIDERIEMFITRIYGVESTNGYNIPSNATESKALSNKSTETTIRNEHSNNQSKDFHDSGSIYNEYLAFQSASNFKLNMHEDLSDDRNLYFSLNLFLQILNAVTELELVEIFTDSEKFIHEHLRILLQPLKTVISMQNKIRPVTIHLIFFIIHFMIKKFTIVKTVIRKSDFTNSVKGLVDDCSIILKQEDSDCFLRIFLFHLLEIQKLKLSPSYFNRLYSVMLPCSCEELFTLPDSLNFFNDGIILSNKITIYILGIMTVSILDDINPLEKFLEISQIITMPFSPNSLIHSADHDIAACSITLENQTTHGFLIFLDHHLIFSIPAPYPQYGSLSIKYYWSFSSIKILKKHEVSVASIDVQINEVQPYNPKCRDIKYTVKLCFVTAYSMETIFEKLSIKLKAFNKTFHQIVNFKLNLNINFMEMDQESMLQQSPLNASLDSIALNSHYPTQSTLLSNIINNNYT